MPKDNMGHISEGAVEDLNIIEVSKEGLPKARLFGRFFRQTDIPYCAQRILGGR